MIIYDTNKVPTKTYITKQDILDKVSEYDIFSRYVGSFKIGAVYNSPFREDKNPSFGIFVSNRDKALLYKDFSTGECGDAFHFVKKLFSLTRYSEVYEKIYEDMSLTYTSKILYTKKEYQIKETKLKVKRKAMSKKDIEYWNSFGITEETLRYYKVDAISEYYANDVRKYKRTDNELAFCYKVFNKFKIYRPLSNKLDKWRSNLSAFDIQGFEQLPEKSETLIITKSLKDVMVLHELGMNAIAPPSESASIPEVVINNLKSRFKKIIVIYDRDKAGVRFCRKIVSLHKFDFYFINKKYKTKDISDFVKAYGLPEAAKLLKNVL